MVCKENKQLVYVNHSGSIEMEKVGLCGFRWKSRTYFSSHKVLIQKPKIYRPILNNCAHMTDKRKHDVLRINS